MGYEVVFTSLALADLDSVLEFYSIESQEASMTFIRCFESCIRLLEQFPNAGFELPHEIRQLIVSRFPYLIYYRIEEEGQVVVQAVLHGRRDPKLLESRLKG